MEDTLHALDGQPAHSDQHHDRRQSSENALPASGDHAPFYSQLGPVPQASHTPSSHYGNSHANFQHQQPMHGFDMSSIGHTLPGSSPSSLSSRGFPKQAPSHTDGISAQTAGMNYGSQMHHYGHQAYPSNMTMHMPVQGAQVYPSGMAPQYYYNGYSVSVPQPPMQRQGQPMAGYPAMSYNRSEFNNQANHSASYLSHPRPELVTQPTPSYPRGPPRKPRQSGHALWVGNLPPATTIGDLKDHFSREATSDIESLFLISKSNCAFVNYCTEAACTAAMGRFHDSRFHGVRLVCRLRRGTPTGGSSSSPTMPELSTSDSLTPESTDEIETPGRKKLVRMSSGPVIVDSSSSQSPKKELQHGVDGLDKAGSELPARVPEKYFVVKSLTLQDLDASVRSGVWATQSHNEVALNHAYETADNVFLVFSANKSGEYFGYARMTSPISSQPTTASTKLQPKTKDLDTGPKSIPTPATQWAPKGRIVDDSARGTIFWEVDSTPDQAEEDVTDDAASTQQDQQQEEKETGSQRQRQEWGKSFQVDWISTNRLPFYRTRGLRNPWNENREIKIARDGTEIEPSIGQRLVQMFHHPVPVPRSSGPPRRES